MTAPDRSPRPANDAVSAVAPPGAGRSPAGSVTPSGGAVPSPYDAPDLYDLLYQSFAIDIPYWREVGATANGPVLEVACGTGRVLLPLLAAGVDVDGVDVVPAMLARLRVKAAAQGLHPALVAADMRDFTMPRRYARAICAFNAFAHCETIDDQLRALRCIREHLDEGGALVMHMSYPPATMWTEPSGEPVFEYESQHPLNGHTLQVWDTRHKNTVGQCQRSEIEIRELDAGGTPVGSQRFETTQRWVYRFELELLFRLAGFTRWDVRGGFENEPLVNDTQQMVAWAWRD